MINHSDAIWLDVDDRSSAFSFYIKPGAFFFFLKKMIIIFYKRTFTFYVHTWGRFVFITRLRQPSPYKPRPLLW